MELLRILAMVLIVFHHFAIHGGFAFGTSVSIPHFWYNLILMGGKLGVDVFVLISGYYLIVNEKTFFNLHRIVKFIGQLVFYSVVFYAVGVLVDIINFSTKTFIKALFPITFSKWWFASTYFLLYLLHPFLNKLLLHIDKNLYQKLLALLVICWSVIPTFTTSSYGLSSLVWFTTLYAIAGYIRLYGLNSKFTTKQYLAGTMIGAALTYASSVVFVVLGTKWNVFASVITYFYGQEKLTILFTAVCLFMVFITVKMNDHKWINLAASATFGVYLIHDNEITRPLLWQILFHNAQYQNSLLLIPYSVIVVVIVYVVCTGIDLLRQRLVEKPFMAVVNHCTEKKIPLFDKVVIGLKDFIFGR